MTLAPKDVPPPNTITKVLRLTRKVTSVKNLIVEVTMTEDQLKTLHQPEYGASSDDEAFKATAWCVVDSVYADQWHTVHSKTDYDTDVLDQTITPDVVVDEANVQCAVDHLAEPDPI